MRLILGVGVLIALASLGLYLIFRPDSPQEKDNEELSCNRSAQIVFERELRPGYGSSYEATYHSHFNDKLHRCLFDLRLELRELREEAPLHIWIVFDLDDRTTLAQYSGNRNGGTGWIGHSGEELSKVQYEAGLKSLMQEK